MPFVGPRDTEHVFFVFIAVARPDRKHLLLPAAQDSDLYRLCHIHIIEKQRDISRGLDRPSVKFCDKVACLYARSLRWKPVKRAHNVWLVDAGDAEHYNRKDECKHEIEKRSRKYRGYPCPHGFRRKCIIIRRRYIAFLRLMLRRLTMFVDIHVGALHDAGSAERYHSQCQSRAIYLLLQKHGTEPDHELRHRYSVRSGHDKVTELVEYYDETQYENAKDYTVPVVQN